MASIKFYSDSEKTNQVYPEINPDGNYPGVTVGLANNLVSPDGITDSDTWIYRSTGGELDVSDGYADLKRLIGSTESSTILKYLYTPNSSNLLPLPDLLRSGHLGFLHS